MGEETLAQMQMALEAVRGSQAIVQVAHDSLVREGVNSCSRERMHQVIVHHHSSALQIIAAMKAYRKEHGL